MSVAEDKSRLRAELRLALARLGQGEIAARSALACGHLLDRWPAPKRVMAYLALPLEADPAGAIASWRARGVIVCVPRIDWASRSMEPAVLGDRVVTGPRGIRQADSAQPTLDPGGLDLVIVPGLGFGLSGARLGRGAGFYDRFLGRVGPGAAVVGLAVREQIRDDLLTEPTDRRVDWIVTDDGAVECRRQESEGV